MCYERSITNHPFNGHYTGQPVLPVPPLEDFVGAKFYCPHALADATSAFGLG